MFETSRAVALRHRYLIGGIVLVAVAAVTLPAYLTPKQWEASATVRLDPAEGFDTALATAQGDQFQGSVTQGSTFPYSFDAVGDPDVGTIRFTAHADSAERASYAAYSVANGYDAWGRAQPAVSRAAELRAQLDALGFPPGDPAVADVEAELASTQATIDSLAGGGGQVTVVPTVPENPSSPNLAMRLALAAALGLVLGFAVAWLRERRADELGDRPTVSRRARTPRTPSRRRARFALGTVAVLAPLLLIASAIAAVVSVWELRPTTNAQDEANFACFPTWLEPIPTGAVVSVSDDSPAFFRGHLPEFTFPRLVVASIAHEPDFTLHIAAGDGDAACGGFHLEGTAP